MLTRLVRISLVVELAAWVGVAAVIRAALGIGWPALAAAVVLAMLAARFALVCLTTFLGWIFRSPRAAAHRLGPLGVARLVATEYRALLLDNFWYLPFDALALRRDPPYASPGLAPVVLVHGYLSNRGYWAPMVRWLEARGVAPVFVPTYSAIFSSIERGAAELHQEIERIAAGGAPRVILVCHSMGGLVARRYLQEHGEGRVLRLVTLASPHHGTVLSRMGIGEHARQMRRGSAFLDALAKAESARAPTVPTASVYSAHDNLVAPQETSRLPWARNVALAGVGHVGILSDPRVFGLVLEELRAAGAARG